MEDLLNYLLPSLGSGALMTYVTHFLTKKKYAQEVNMARAEARGKELDNVEKAATIWRQLSEQMKATFDAEIVSLRNTVTDLNAQVSSLSKQLDNTKKELEETKKALNASRKENERFSEQLKIFNKNFSHESASKG